MTSLVWLERDLRTVDHPALVAAAADGPVVPVFVWAPEELGEEAPGAAQRAWLHACLAALAPALDALGSPLVLRRGPTARELVALAREVGARAVHRTRSWTPVAASRDERVAAALRTAGVRLVEHEGWLLHDPSRVRSGSGGSYAVFTPFARRLGSDGVAGQPVPAPRLAAPATVVGSVELSALGLRPAIPWDQPMLAGWVPGEAGALAALEHFAPERRRAAPIDAYREGRDQLAGGGTSRLSAYLAVGAVSPRSAWAAAARARKRADAAPGAEAWQRQLLWREFAHHVLWGAPHTATEPLRPEFTRFPWRDDPALLRAWQRGRTGEPLVDAAQSELWHTGWMHNRSRMVSASYLTKDLMIHWHHGAEWFRDTLIDFDPANNVFGWQWTAGCGADAAPYFRVFNPTAQAARYDSAGRYRERWGPVLQHPPLVDHAVARERALAAWHALRGGEPEAPRRSSRDGTG